MGISNLTVFSALTEKMRWHQARQGVLAENVANANTPGYRAQELKAPSFESELGMANVQMTATNAAHFTASSGGAGGFSATSQYGFEVTPDKNAVGLEGQMMKVASNQMDYQAVTTLYTRSIRLLRTALGR